MNPFEVEILRTGVWHGTGCPKDGCKFTDEDLQDLVANFNELREAHKVPLKRGHSVEVGDIALGWVEGLRIEGATLIGQFSDVPEVVRSAIKKKLFRKVSIEAMRNVVLGGKKLKGWVLDAVALLGAEIPAVAGLKDLDAYLARSSLEHGQVVTFSTTKGSLTDKQEIKMDKEFEERFKALEQIIASSNEKVTTVSKENETLKTENTKMKRDAEERTTNERKAKIEMNRAQVTSTLEQAVKDKLILPAARETFSKLLKVSDDEAMLSIVIEDVEKLVQASGGTKMKFNREQAQKDVKKDDRVHDDAGDELNRLALAYKDDHENMTYDVALNRVMAMHRDLACEHIGELDKEVA